MHILKKLTVTILTAKLNLKALTAKSSKPQTIGPIVFRDCWKKTTIPSANAERLPLIVTILIKSKIKILKLLQFFV